MTVKQQKFADEYIKTGNATQSAIKAGYAKRSAKQIGQQNLTKHDVKHYIDGKLKEISDKQIADGAEVMKYLTSVMRGKQKETTLIGMGMGVQGTTEVPVSAKDRIKAAELVGKRYSLFTDKVDLTQGDINIKIGDYDADD